MDEQHHHFSRDRNQGIWIEPSDRLYCAAYSSVASLAVRFSGYFRKASGEVSEYAVTINPTSDRAVTASDTFFGAGFLLSCVAHLASGNANRGQCYVRAQVQRGTGTAAVKLHTVVAGYVSDDYSPSFPYGKFEGPLEGRGYDLSLVVANPGAGNIGTITVPTGAVYRVRSVFYVFTASAAVASRHLFIDINSTAIPYARLPVQNAITAGLTSIIMWAVGMPIFTNSNVPALVMPFPDLYLHGGATIELEGVALDVGDTYTNIGLQVEEWIEA